MSHASSTAHAVVPTTDGPCADNYHEGDATREPQPINLLRSPTGSQPRTQARPEKTQAGPYLGTGRPHPQREPYSRAARPQLCMEGSPPGGRAPSPPRKGVPTRGARALNH